MLDWHAHLPSLAGEALRWQKDDLALCRLPPWLPSVWFLPSAKILLGGNRRRQARNEETISLVRAAVEFEASKGYINVISNTTGRQFSNVLVGLPRILPAHPHPSAFPLIFACVERSVSPAPYRSRS